VCWDCVSPPSLISAFVVSSLSELLQFRSCSSFDAIGALSQLSSSISTLVACFSFPSRWVRSLGSVRSDVSSCPIRVIHRQSNLPPPPNPSAYSLTNRHRMATETGPPQTTKQSFQIHDLDPIKYKDSQIVCEPNITNEQWCGIRKEVPTHNCGSDVPRWRNTATFKPFRC
jgi:hypothetical protein